MQSQLTTRSKFIWLAVLLTGFALLLAVAFTDTASAAPAAPDWHFQASAQANCAQDNQSAEVGWIFENRDTRAMRVTVSLEDGSTQVRDVQPGALEAGTFTGLAIPLPAGAVRFDMRWIGYSGHDSTTRSYGDVACIPTAVSVSSFSAKPAGTFWCPCAKAVYFRWLDAQKRSCTFTTTRTCWGRVYLYQSPTACQRMLAGWNYCGA